MNIYPTVLGASRGKQQRHYTYYPTYPAGWEPCSGAENMVKAITSTHNNAAEILSQYPIVFNGQVTTMVGECFAISLTEGAKLFCVKAPQSVPFAYREKLKEELYLLQQQGIIAPVTEVTE